MSGSLTDSAALAKALPHLGPKDLDVLSGGPDEPLVLELAEVLAGEVEPLRERCDAGLLGGEFQPAFAHELLDERPRLSLQEVSRRTGNDEVIRISHQGYLGSIVWLSATVPSFEGVREQPFQPVPWEVRQRRRTERSEIAKGRSLCPKGRAGGPRRRQGIGRSGVGGRAAGK